MNTDDTMAPAEWAELQAADTPQAWSQCEQPEPVLPARWSRAWMKVAAAAVGVGSALGGGLLLLDPAQPQMVAAPVVVASSGPSTQAEPPFVAPTVAALPETPDGQYLSILARSKVIVVNPGIMIATGHKICDNMAATGTDIGQQTDEIFHAPNANGTFTIAHIHSVVLAAVTAYCPQFLDRP